MQLSLYKKIYELIVEPYQGFTKETWRFLLAGFLNAIGAIIIIYISLYLNSLQYSIKYIGILLTLFGASGILGAYCGGICTNYFKPTLLCKITLLLSGLIFLLFPLLHNYFAICIASSIISFLSNAFRSAFILVLASGEEKKSLENVVALRRIAINLGMAFGAAINGLLANVNFSLVFFFNGISAICAFLIIIKLSNHNTINARGNTQTPDRGKGELNFCFTLLMMFLVLLVFNQSQATYPIYLKNNLFLTEKFISLLFSISGIMIALLQAPVSNIAKKYNPSLVCSLGSLLICSGFFMLPWSKSEFSIIISCILWTLGEIVFFPTQLVMTIRLLGNNVGKKMGLYQMVFSLASFVSPMFGTAIYAYEPDLVWYTCGFLGIISAVAYLKINFGALMNTGNSTDQI